MNIQQYIHEVISGIFAAIEQLQIENGEGASIKGVVKPSAYNATSDVCKIDDVLHSVHHIKFDVSLAVTEAQSTEAKGGVSLKVISIGGEIGNSTANQAVQKVSFEIPVIYPTATKSSNNNQNVTGMGYLVGR